MRPADALRPLQHRPCGSECRFGEAGIGLNDGIGRSAASRPGPPRRPARRPRRPWHLRLRLEPAGRPRLLALRAEGAHRPRARGTGAGAAAAAASANLLFAFESSRPRSRMRLIAPPPAPGEIPRIQRFHSGSWCPRHFWHRCAALRCHARRAGPTAPARARRHRWRCRARPTQPLVPRHRCRRVHVVWSQGT